MQRPQIQISILILLVIGFQASTFLTGTKIWPFMAYCMYSSSRGPGPIHAEKSRIVGISASGKDLEVNPKFVGLGFFAYNHLYLQPMRQGNQSAARRLADRLNRGLQDSFVSFRVETDEYTIVDGNLIIEQKEATYLVAD